MSGKRQHKREEPHGIRLPGSLLDELKTKGVSHADDEDNSRFSLASNFESKKRKSQVSRKDKRKQERDAKRQRKVPNHQHKEAHNKSTPSDKRKSKGSKDPKISYKKQESETESENEDNIDEFTGFDDNQDEADAETFGSSDDYDDFDDEFDDIDSDADIDEEDFEDDEEDQPQTAEDTMKALMALKAKKQQKQPSSAEETMALLKAKKDAKSKSKSKEPTAEETMELLRKQKETKQQKKDVKKESTKAKKSKAERYLTPEDEMLLKRDEDDIKYYAKKLGLKSTKLSDLKDNEDGLGGLLDGLDFLDNYGDEGGNDSYGDYEQSDTDSMENISEDEEDDDDENIDDEDEHAEESQNEEQGEIIDNPFSSDDEINSSDFDSDLDGELDEEEEEGDVLRPEPKENPYVAPAGAKKYVPPALRQRLQNSEDSEQTINIKRAIKGPLNKLSEANILTIVNEINAVYMDKPRQVVTECLTSVVLESIVQQGVLLDTFVILHAALIGSIYRLQGVEAGAYFIQTLVEKYEDYYKNQDSKASGNLISFLTACYSFQIISCKLLYNLISTLIEDISELNSELLLRIVKNAGQQMRIDDPNSLKEIILQLQKNLNGKETNVRTKFLVETITNLKNNKSKLNNEAARNLITRMKKVLGGINNNKFHEALQVTLDDIHSVETKGKWWLVGAAWKGNLADSSRDQVAVNEEQLNDILDTAEPNWMELARSQRMNTDIRRAIFISIMSSSDYIEAFTKLDKLRLKRSQEREIPKILLHCVSIEKLYNPYYGLLANKLCSGHGLRKTFQFSLWDLLKEVEGDEGDDNSDDEGDDYFKNLNHNMTQEDDDFQLQRIVNLGKFFGVLTAEGSVPLHSFKNINFVSLNSDASLLLEVLLISFFDTIGKKSEVAAFGNGSKKSKASELKFQDTLLIERLAKCQEQRSMLRGLQYFLQKKIRNSDIINGRKQTRRVEWGVDSTCDIVDEFLKDEQ